MVGIAVSPTEYKQGAVFPYAFPAQRPLIGDGGTEGVSCKDVAQMCMNCAHMEHIRTTDGVICETYRCDLDGFYLVRKTHSCRKWKSNDGKENIVIHSSYLTNGYPSLGGRNVMR